MARSYRELLVWQKAKALAVAVYRATEHFPKHELYGLTSQIRRAAVSVPSNIAEGQGRLGPSEFRHFLGQARGSLLELDTQISIAKDLEYLDDRSHKALDDEILPCSRTAESSAGVAAGETFETLKHWRL